MNWFREIGRQLLMLLRREQFDADLEEEMRLPRSEGARADRRRPFPARSPPRGSTAVWQPGGTQRGESRHVGMELA